jgi:hypothetical protein
MDKPTKGGWGMNSKLRHGAFAVALIGGAGLLAAPAFANAVEHEGYFGGSWNSIGPSDYEQRRHAGRVGPLHGNRVYVAPYYSYGPAYYGSSAYYGPLPYDDDLDYAPGPAVSFVAPGAALSIGID